VYVERRARGTGAGRVALVHLIAYERAYCCLTTGFSGGE
jgi:hypothetical protein